MRSPSSTKSIAEQTNPHTKVRLSFGKECVEPGQHFLVRWGMRIQAHGKGYRKMAQRNMRPVSEESVRLGAYVQRLRLERKPLHAQARRSSQSGFLVCVAPRTRVSLEHQQHGSSGRLPGALDIEVADLYSEAGFVDAHGLPGFAPYLRAKYHLPDDAVDQLLAHFALINEKYRSTEEEAPNGKHDH